MWLILLSGCGRSDAELLKPFCGTFRREVSGKVHDIVAETSEERRVRWMASTFGDESRVIEEFLRSKPPVSESMRQRLEEYHRASARLVEIHGLLLDERRFELTAEEKEERDFLIDVCNHHRAVISKVTGERL